MGKEKIVLYHRIMQRENFEKAAKDLFNLVKTAEKRQHGKARILYLDIDGHRNEQGDFDEDMLEIQKEFGVGFLLRYLTEVHFPLGSFKNENAQCNDLPDEINIFNANNKKNHDLEDLYIENFSNTEYQSETTVLTYLTKVSNFLKYYQDLDVKYSLLTSESFDPHNYLFHWRKHIKELMNELFNMFVGGNLFSAAAMTRTLMECYLYVKILRQEKNGQLLEDWYLCGLIRSFKCKNGNLSEKERNIVNDVCKLLNRNPNEIMKKFEKGNENEWLKTVITDEKRISFFKICNYFNEEELYKDYQWACSFVHGQDIYCKMTPFLSYDSIYHLLTIIMKYIFKSIYLYPVSDELERKIVLLENDLINLWGTTSWDK